MKHFPSEAMISALGASGSGTFLSPTATSLLQAPALSGVPRPPPPSQLPPLCRHSAKASGPAEGSQSVGHALWTLSAPKAPAAPRNQECRAPGSHTAAPLLSLGTQVLFSVPNDHRPKGPISCSPRSCHFPWDHGVWHGTQRGDRKSSRADGPAEARLFKSQFPHLKKCDPAVSREL